jgi:tryptophanyl-tRNA synthetase
MLSKEDKKMASVNTETTITLTPDEKELLEKAMKKMDEIAANVRCDTDLFIDTNSIFNCLDEAYRQNKENLPTVIQIWE